MNEYQFKKEGWILIPGYEELYAFRINDEIIGGEVLAFRKSIHVLNGGIRIYPERIKQHVIDSDGYLRTSLCKNGVQKTWGLHQISAIIYLPNPENKPHINHRFGIKTDNRPSQIEWCTIAENNQHMHRTGLVKNDSGLKDSQSIQVLQKTLSGGLIKVWGSIGEASRELNICKSNIARTSKKIYSQSHGFKWEYKNKVA